MEDMAPVGLGTSNIDGGITVDLGLLTWTVVVESSQNTDENKKLPRWSTSGPGARWRDVYAALDVHELMVAGGLEGSVGVEGLLLGRGISFLSAAADSRAKTWQSSR